MMRICQVVFSANRPEYLRRTLAAQSLIDFTGCEVDRILIDDYPKGRDDEAMRYLAESHGYEVDLHVVNQSLGVTWKNFWQRIRDRDYDYVWHQEDDTEILEPIAFTDLAAILDENPRFSQVVLRRQKWYPRETETGPEPDDILWGCYRIEAKPPRCYYFSPMASFYPMARVRLDYDEWFRKNYPRERFHQTNRNEGLIGKVLLEGCGLVSAHLKTKDGQPLVRHIGDYNHGQILLPGEIGSDIFAGVDPEKEYCSRTGKLYVAA